MLRLLVPTLAVGLVSLYFISRNRKIELEVEMKMEPKEDSEASVANLSPAI